MAKGTAVKPTINENSYMVPLTSQVAGEVGQQLHIRHIYADDSAPAVLLLHGLAEDGTIYYSRTGKGLAYFLVNNGFQVFVPDLRGKGRSWPSVQQLLNCRVIDIVTVDLPAVFDFVSSKLSGSPDFLIGHGFGGVLISSFLARYPEYRKDITGVVQFGSRRVAAHRNLYQRIFIDWLWNRLAGFASQLRGVVPARLLRLGSADEHPLLREESLHWLNGKPWLDPSDDFDYGKALNTGLEFPPSLYFASRRDLGWGSPEDVRSYMREVGQHNGRLVVLGKNEGNCHNYSHIGMLVHPDAESDHFPFMIEWLVEMLDLRRESQLDVEPKGPVETG